MLDHLSLLYIRFASTLINPGEIGFDGPTKGDNFVKNLLNGAYFWAGVIAVIVIIAAGIFYIISQGDASKIARAKQAIIGAISGLVVIILAFAITNFVIGAAG